MAAAQYFIASRACIANIADYLAKWRLFIIARWLDYGPSRRLVHRRNSL